jgi:lipoprotein-anchoring transpeptidase ErfK/SrfK
MFIFASRFSNTISLLTLSVLAFVASACAPQPGTPINSGTGNSNNNSNIQASPSATASPVPRVAFTLPLLDALLGDEQFVSEMKTAVPLTDEEVDKLRRMSQDAIANLSDDPAEDDSRSTRASSEDAKRQLERVLGPERSNKLVNLIDQRLAGDGTLADAKPNQVPTDTRVVVNAPAYRMDIFENGKLTQSYKVGIGYPEFPLPTGLRSAKSIIYNPTWTPPDEPWVKGKVQPGKTVGAGDKLNPLGPIKIPIGLPSLIHGGKSPARLGTFASHGCVGLTNDQIQDFAMKLSAISGEPLTMGDIKSYAKNKTETKDVKLAQPVPVELRYETIVVEDGVLKIYRDVYERGTNSEENLSRVLEVYGLSLDSLQPEQRAQILEGLKQMAVDATGQAVSDVTGNENQNTANQNRAGGTNSKTNANSGDGRVTRNVKGKKMVEFKLAELAGKGYPAPVGVKM